MDKITDVPFDKSSSRKEDIYNQKKCNGILVVDKLQSIDDQRIMIAKPTVAPEGLLIPFTYVKTIQDNKPIDTLYYMLIDKETLKETAKLIRECDDGK